MKRLVLGTLLIVTLLAVAALGWLIFATSSLCGNTIFENVPSPAGKYRAILFERNCGATTGFSTQVAIIGASEDLPNEPGNVMTADGHPLDGKWAIRWTNAETLSIRVHSLEKINRRETKVEGVTVRYVRQY